jgi:uncharacterized protein YdeI (YjbR/CyaY-like superfamily)
MEYRFINKDDCLQWFSKHVYHESIWIVFDKRNISEKLTYEQALDIALCYGWIDGQLKKINENEYKRLFARRRPESAWSTKNKNAVDRLTKDGLMTEHGLKVIQVSKENGRYQQADLPPLDFSMESFDLMIKPYELAYNNYTHMSQSIKKTYALSYYTAKKEETRIKRLSQIIERLEKNLKPME